MSREKTAEEVRDEFLAQVRCIVHYWANLPNTTPADRCEGVAFSIMNILDGTSCLPAFDLVIRPHPDDRRFHIDQGDDYYPDGTVINECMMHELLVQK